MANTQSMVIAVLRAASEPLSSDQILSRVVEQLEPGAAPPARTTISRALENNPLVEKVGRDRWVYLPRAFVGASFRHPLLGIDEQCQRLPIGFEVVTALCPAWTKPDEPIKLTLLLAGGPSLEILIPSAPGLQVWLGLPPESGDAR